MSLLRGLEFEIKSRVCQSTLRVSGLPHLLRERTLSHLDRTSLLEVGLRDRDLLEAIVYVNVEAVEEFTVADKGDLLAFKHLLAKERKFTDFSIHVLRFDLLIGSLYHAKALFEDVLVLLLYEEFLQFLIHFLFLSLLIAHLIVENNRL